MNWEPLDVINFFGIFVIFTMGGFFIGCLMGYIWLQLEQRKIMKALGLLGANGAGTELSNNYIHTRTLQEPHEIGPIKFYSIPVGYHPWEQTREYAKGA
ncbi:MAG: hypothetical protein NPIRA05_15580 [Nitrospirales bacterium]|nr:MAG: hypothetical protein NPIRA05_15580 [Nitrospirales bacterium]